MKVVVCVRRLVNGEINPFDACCYEAALRLEDAEITLLSMGPPSVSEFLHGLTRLGAGNAVLLSDNAFAGADTLATSYTLSLAIKRLSPQLVLCGRQTVDGDTGQVGPELATMLGYSLITNVMKLESRGGETVFETRDGQVGAVSCPSLLTVERINTLRLPSIRSRLGELEIWDADMLAADIERCGTKGSPTKVISTFKNSQDRRKCKFIPLSELGNVISEAMNKPRLETNCNVAANKLKNAVIIGASPLEFARSISESVTAWNIDSAEKIAERIKAESPEVILWGSDPVSKRISAQVAAMLELGLCADCTRLESDGRTLFMYRPAFSGDVIAKIVSRTLPQMATVRTVSANRGRVAVGVGFGAKEYISEISKLAEKLSAELVSSRKLVDHGYMPYSSQVGLTGTSIGPDVYLAVGISGAVHHIAGIKASGTVIAINPDKDAQIFNYSDYGVICDAEDLSKSEFSISVV